MAANEDQYRSRNNGLKSPAVSNERGKTFMVEDFINNNYNVIYVPYCSNDIHQGTHINNIDGKKFIFMVDTLSRIFLISMMKSLKKQIN